MGGFFGSLLSLAMKFGGLGVLIVSIADSSFLVIPIANDLLVVFLTARNHTLMPYYAALATVGSLGGFFILDVIFRKGGHAMLDKHLPAKRLDYVKKKIEERGEWALVMVSIIPPPFPTKPFIVAASALQYPRKKMFSIIGASRFGRFLVDGVIAIFLGDKVVKFAESPILQYVVYALLGIGVLGSAGSVYLWIKRSRQEERRGQIDQQAR